MKQNILNYTLEDLRSEVKKLGLPAFRANQIFEWIYKKGITKFEQIKNISQANIDILKKKFDIYALELKDHQLSCDGTEKFLFRLEDGNLIETVFIPHASHKSQVTKIKKPAESESGYRENRRTGYPDKQITGSPVTSYELPVTEHNNRNTVCVSTQVGCKFKCLFCASGTYGFERNLSCGEILSQILYIKFHTEIPNEIPAGACPRPTILAEAGMTQDTGHKSQEKNSRTRLPAGSLEGELANSRTYKEIHNIVFMGIGEPLDNYESVINAFKIINDTNALNVGKRKITISTCGLIPEINRLRDSGLNLELSISLHAPTDEIRSKLMPVNKKYPLPQLIKCAKEYTVKTKRSVTFEYALVKNMNSSKDCAEKLAKIAKDKLFMVNLIPLNQIQDTRHRTQDTGVGEAGPPLADNSKKLKKHVIPARAKPDSRGFNLGIQEDDNTTLTRPEIDQFKKILEDKGVKVTVRNSRGADIDAACGQLKAKKEFRIQDSGFRKKT